MLPDYYKKRSPTKLNETDRIQSNPPLIFISVSKTITSNPDHTEKIKQIKRIKRKHKNKIKRFVSMFDQDKIQIRKF